MYSLKRYELSLIEVGTLGSEPVHFAPPLSPRYFQLRRKPLLGRLLRFAQCRVFVRSVGVGATLFVSEGPELRLKLGELVFDLFQLADPLTS